MARLSSEETDCPSSLYLKAGPAKELKNGDQIQKWQEVVVILESGRRRIESADDEDFLLCRTPEDEVLKLVDFLEELAEKKRQAVLFEPCEPSFEISFTRTPRGGIQVEAWLDAGNAGTGIYTWDASGIRFCTNDEHLVSFIKAARQEFFPTGK